MRSEPKSPVRCPRCPGRSQITHSPGGAAKIRRRQCQRCSHTWSTVEVTQDAYRALEARIQDLEDDLLQAQYEVDQQKRFRMTDLRSAVGVLARFSMVDHNARLHLEFLKTRGEFLHRSLSEPESSVA